MAAKAVLRANFRLVKGSGKFLLVKSGILGFGIRNPSSSDKYWNPVESQGAFDWEIWI